MIQKINIQFLMQNKQIDVKMINIFIKDIFN